MGKRPQVKPHYQDSGNDPQLNRWELEDRIACFKGFDQNMHPKDIKQYLEEFGDLTALSVIRGRFKDANSGRIRWVSKTVTYAEYASQDQLLNAAVNARTSVLSVHGERVKDRLIEVYRSNKKRTPWEAKDPGWTNHLIEEDDMSESLKSWWINERRENMLYYGKDKVVVQGQRGRRRREQVPQDGVWYHIPEDPRMPMEPLEDRHMLAIVDAPRQDPVAPLALTEGPEQSEEEAGQ